MCAPVLDTRFRRELEYPLPDRPGVGKRTVLFCAECLPSEVPAASSEIRELLILPYEAALAALPFPDLKQVLRDAEAYLEGQGNRE